MKRGSTIFLQVSNCTSRRRPSCLAALEPQVEGRNVHATQLRSTSRIHSWRIYTWPSSHFLSVCTRHQDIRVCPTKRNIFQRSVRALRIIKYCALTTALFIVGAEAYIFIFVRGTDDVAGGVMMGPLLFSSLPLSPQPPRCLGGSYKIPWR